MEQTNSELKRKNTTLKIINYAQVIAIIILIGAILFMSLNSDQDNELYKTILNADAKVSDISIIEQKGISYYEASGLAYENQNYPLVESNCKLARDSFSQESQEYLKVASELKRSKINDPLVDNYIERLELLSEIKLNLYEACEHFEAAARYYNLYYNTNVAYDDPSYDMGTGEIAAMNDKINLHDSNVRKFNSLLADFTTELEDRLK